MVVLDELTSNEVSSPLRAEQSRRAVEVGTVRQQMQLRKSTGRLPGRPKASSLPPSHLVP